MTFCYDSYCGLYCGACAVLKANEDGTLQEKCKEWDIAPEDAHCHGCKSDTPAVYCRTCDIKKCAEEKNVNFCFQCTEYLCPRLTAFKNDEHPHHSVIFKNLETIKNKGVESWLKEQKSRWSCSECGTSYTWYDNVCPQCGSTVYNCIHEENDEVTS